MTVLTWVNLMVGLGDTVFLFLLGVDYAVLWGLLAWFMGYIPSRAAVVELTRRGQGPTAADLTAAARARPERDGAEVARALEALGAAG